MICFVVALPAEASPIIKHYQLHALTHASLFPVYQRQNISLIVSGVGKVSAGAAVAYLHSLLEKKTHIAWLNIGIAGHQNFMLNQGFLAHKIVDQASQLAWYPARLTSLNITSHEVITVDTANPYYATDDLYEMEASGFYQLATSCSTNEIIQCYKIISDNRTSSIKNINAKHVKQLINDHLDIIDQLSSDLQKTALTLDSIHKTPDLYFELIKQHHFTQTQQHQLKRLLKHWQALSNEPLTLNSLAATANNADKVIAKLTKMLNHLPVNISSTTKPI